ncbi:hypothetical protein [Methanoculleus chikugoensis]|uniref:hypothetical protein n=1 Tax=Methanoculleus chikugoensis TaxID=118126 RepID=UPI0006D006AF|nr:hypothetical protein [Methanoculleus chikugoensis]
MVARVRIVVPDRLEGGEDPEPSAKKGKGFFRGGGGDKMKASVEEGGSLSLWRFGFFIVV